VRGQHSDGVPGHAFISYVREDRERVDRLQATLERAGIRVWRDTADIRPGRDWGIEIRRAIMTGSFAFLACFSENTERRVTSYQNEELILAVEQMRLRVPGQVWLFPVRFAECTLPPFDLGAGRRLDSLQCIDLFDDSWEPGISLLVGAVLSALHAHAVPAGTSSAGAGGSQFARGGPAASEGSQDQSEHVPVEPGRSASSLPGEARPDTAQSVFTAPGPSESLSQTGRASGLASCRYVLGGHGQPVQDIAFTADGEFLVTLDGIYAKTWSIAGTRPGELVRAIRLPEAYWLTGDGSLAATITGEIRRTQDALLVGSLLKGQRIASASFSADGSAFAFALRQEAASGNIVISGGDNYSRTGDNEVDVSLIFMKGSEESRKHKGSIVAGDPMRKDRIEERNATTHGVGPIYIRSADGAVQCIPVSTKSLALELKVSPDGRFMAYFVGGNAHLIDLSTGEARHTFAVPGGYMPWDCIAFSPQSDLMACGTINPNSTEGWKTDLTVWETGSGAQRWSQQMPGFGSAIAFSRDGRTVATLNTEGSVKLFDVAQQSILSSAAEHGGAPCACICFSPDNTMLATSGDRNVKVWALPSKPNSSDGE